jgi:hypothetical protein
LADAGADTVIRSAVSTTIRDTIVPKMANAARSNAWWFGSAEAGAVSAGAADAGAIGSSVVEVSISREAGRKSPGCGKTTPIAAL